jgi:phosphoglucosamine mutase
MNKYFGTDGIRGKTNVELTPTLAFKIGRYLGEYHNKKKRNTVLIGRDTRISGFNAIALYCSWFTIFRH